MIIVIVIVIVSNSSDSSHATGLGVSVSKAQDLGSWDVQFRVGILDLGLTLQIWDL